MRCSGTLVVGPPGQPGEALLLENARDADGAEFVLQQTLNIVDGEILFTGLNDPLAQWIGLGCHSGALGGGNKESPVRLLPEVMDQNAKTACGVAETVGRLFGRQMINKEGPKGLVLTMGGIGGLEKGLGELCYLFVFIVKHNANMSRCSG